jgi:uncharacterized protein YbjT (DUF2867 family)
VKEYYFQNLEPDFISKVLWLEVLAPRLHSWPVACTSPDCDGLFFAGLKPAGMRQAPGAARFCSPQWMSWIERDDLVRLIAHALAKPEISGPINATAPIPVRNSTFTEELGRRLQRPAVFRIPAALLHRVAGDFADELLLGGQRVIPNKVLSSGFVFRHETLRSAFEAIL